MGIDLFDLFGNSDSKLIPGRDPAAISGSEFIKHNLKLKGSVRDQNILNEFICGNIPDFLRNFAAITLSENNNTITYLVMSDYLCIGSDNDYVRMPMSPLTAQKIADKYDCSLPTRKMVKDIWKQSYYKLNPLPWGPPYDHSMINTDRIGVHHNRIQMQLSGKDTTKLISGHKKDVVLTNNLSPKNIKKRVAIYGWIQSNGIAIQDLNTISHDDLYYDYSHGIRLISNDVIVNGSIMKLSDLFKNKILCNLVSDEGVITFTKY